MKYLSALAAFLCLTASGLAVVDPAAYTAAVELYRQRKPLEAQQAFEALAQADANNADVQSYLGRLAMQRGEMDKATAYLEKTVALSPDTSRYHQWLGDAYGQAAEKASFFSQMGLAKKCKAEYEKAVELDGKNIDARFGLMTYYQQVPGIAGGSMEKAHEQAREIKKLNPSRGRSAVAGLYVTDKKYDLAFAEYEEVLKVTPDDYGALFQTGRLSAISGQRLEPGLAMLRKCLDQVPPEGQPTHAAAHWRIGNILEKQGNKAGARASYEAALKVDPKFPQALESLKKL